MISRLLVVGGILIVAFFVAISPSCSLEINKDGEVAVPEYWFREHDTPRCVIKAAANRGNGIERRKYFMEFVANAFSETDGWKKDFTISGIDYVDFRYFHIITFSNCNSSPPLLAHVSDVFGRCSADKKHLCGSRLRFSEVPNSVLVAVLTPDEIRTPISEFLHYRGDDDLRRCTIENVLKDDAPEFSIVDDLIKLRLKYRISMIDVSLLNGKLHVLLSRQCDKKRVIYKRILELLAHENPDVAGYLGNANFDPDISEYRWSQTGQ